MNDVGRELLLSLLQEQAEESIEGESEIEPFDATTPLVQKKSLKEELREALEIQPALEILTGRIHPELAHKVAHLLGQRVGDIRTWDFPNAELFAKLGDSVRGKDVFFIQPTTWAPKDQTKGPHYPPGNESFSPNDAMMELLGSIRTIKTSTVDRVTAVIPYFGEQQSDKKDQPRVAIWAKLWADLLEKAGVDRVVLLDLHAEQIQGFFDSTKVGIDHLYSTWALLPYLKKFVQENQLTDLVFASPDAGGVKRSEFFAKEFSTGSAYGNKTRLENGTAEVLAVVGDVEGKDVIVVDDLINTGTTLVKFANALKAKGARRIFVVAPHAGFNGNATQQIQDSPIEKVIVTDSMPLGNKEYFKRPDGTVEKTTKIIVVSIARLLANTIRNIHLEQSVSQFFVKNKDKRNGRRKTSAP